MDESEQALSDAARSSGQFGCHIARQVLSNPKTYRLWESHHADLVESAAEHSRRAPQILALRDIEVRLLHRRALISYIREHHIVGGKRDKLFAVFYGPLDTTNAILAEHRQYSLAVSSRISVDHLIDIMCDPVSVKLIREYEWIYSAYFDLFCYIVNCRNAAMADLTRQSMLDLRRRAMQMIKRIHSEQPDSQKAGFDRQALLARSWHHPAVNYMMV